MAEFTLLEDSVARKWVIAAPRRAIRTNAGKKIEPICPFCIGRESDEPELYRIPHTEHNKSSWAVRVIPNKFPFTPHHEIIIHSPDHHKNFDELPFSQVEIILQTYRERYNTHREQGYVYLFHNRGIAAGESLPHPHTQLTILPHNMSLSVKPMAHGYRKGSWERFFGRKKKMNEVFLEQKVETEHFFVFCPETSEWPDEVWIAPKEFGQRFGDITDQQIFDLSFVLTRIIQLFNVRHGAEFPFNFYIYPGKNWYLRLIPRIKILGGFELGTGIMVNTQDPKETLSFLKEHFWEPNIAKIKDDYQADYWISV